MSLFSTLAHLFHPRHSNKHRPALVHPQTLAILAAVVLVFSIVVRFALPALRQAGSILGYASNITAADVVAKTNQERAAQGLSELTVNHKLNEAALAKAAYMFEKQYWAHVAPDGTQPWSFFKQAKYDYRVAGENLARDFSNGDDMMRAWMASPTHRANIVSDKYQEIGVAVVDGTLLGTETTLVVQLFGTPRQGQAQVAPPTIGFAEEPRTATAKVPAVNQATSQQAQSNQAAQSPVPADLPVPVLEDTTLTAAPLAPRSVLGSRFFTLSTLKAPPLFSPLQLSKLFFLGIIFMIVFTLLYDAAIMGHRTTVRLVGKNFAHIMFLIVVAYLLIFFKAGVIG